MKNIQISPSTLNGEVNIPPSKSISHRAIIAAGLSEGKSYLSNIILSDDIIATIEGMRSFGISIELKKQNDKTYNVVVNSNGKLKPINNEIDCKESGSTLRFLIPISRLINDKIVFTGSGKLVERPLDIYYKIFNEQGISYSNDQGKLPLTVSGALQAGNFNIRGDISSQFVSGLLFTLPLLNGDSRITITKSLESKGYVDLTMDILKKFSINVENHNYEKLVIKGNQRYTPMEYRVEGDYSQGAFWIVAGLLGGKIISKDLNIDSLQGDKAIIHIVKDMGGNISIDQNTISAKKSTTNGIIIDGSECPDLVPILASLGSLSIGTTRIINAERLRIKESDRLKAMATELEKLGADIKETEDGLLIHGKEYLDGGLVDSWNDHRIAMALAIASIRCKNTVTITNSHVVNKSYPGFWQDFIKLGGKCKI